MHIQSVNMEVI